MGKPVQLSLTIRDRRTCYWHWAPDEIIDEYGALLGPEGLSVYYALARHAHGGTERSWVSMRRMGEVTGLSKDQVARQVRNLEQLGLVSVVQRGRMNLATEYQLLDPPEEISSVRRATSAVTPKHPGPGCRGPSPPNARLPVAPDAQTATQPDDVVGGSTLRQDQQQQHAGGCRGDRAGLAGMLIDFGISPETAVELARISTGEQVEGWIACASDPKNRLRNPQGFVVDRLEKGAQPPKPKDDRRRYVQGEYADHIEH